jgi:GNAT superfamily N-acetyltransferase
MVRSAKIEDVEEIRILLGQLGYETLTNDGIQRKIFHYNQENYRLYVIETEQQVVGFIALHCYETFHSPGKTGRITAFSIHHDFHSKGFGKQLLNHAELYFINSGCTKVEVTSNKRRAQAHSFYLSQGYIEDSRKFIKSLL